MVSSSPSTLSALASLFSGKPACEHGAHVETPHLAPEHRLLAEYLRTAGYRTLAITCDSRVGAEWGLGRGFDTVVGSDSPRSSWLRRLRHRCERWRGRADAGARRANRRLLRWLEAGSGPFFAFLHYGEARLGATLPRPFDRMFLPSGADPRQASLAARHAITEDGSISGGAAAIPLLRARYEGAVRYLDERLAEIAAHLRAKGEWDRTLVVVTADHGVCLGEHGRLGHSRGMYDALLRVPLLMRCPGAIPAGFVVEEIAQTMDVAPTILAQLGIHVRPTDVRGRALVSAGRVEAGPEYSVSERFRDASGVRVKAIRGRRDKLVWRSDEANELFDLLADPEETVDRFEQEAERAALLRSRLFDWLAVTERRLAQAGGGGEAAV